MEPSCSCPEMTNADWVTDWQPPSQERLSAAWTGPMPLHRRQGGRSCSPGRRAKEVQSLSRPPGPCPGPTTAQEEQIWNRFMCAPRARGTAPTLFTKTGQWPLTCCPVLTFLSLQRHSHYQVVSLQWLHIPAITIFNFFFKIGKGRKITPVTKNTWKSSILIICCITFTL